MEGLYGELEMDCKEVCNLAGDYVFGLLEPDVELHVTSHLGSCEACAQVIEHARSQRRLFSAWEVTGTRGAADRLLGRIRSGKVKARARYEHLFVRIMAAAAAILAAVVLPMIFMVQRPAVLPGEAQVTTVKGVFDSTRSEEFDVPAGHPDAWIVVRLRSADGKSALQASIRLNEGDAGPITSSASKSEEVFLLSREHGLREGRNKLLIENLGQGSLEFEVTLVCPQNQ